jgi:hypothetical protein
MPNGAGDQAIGNRRIELSTTTADDFRANLSFR